MRLRLARVSEYNGATMGVLCFNEKPEILTLEEAWRGNEKNVSCVPEGRYKVKRVNSPKFGITFQIVDVPGRDHILFHIANTTDDVDGCVALGQRYGSLGGRPAILNSSKAFEQFMKLMNGVDEAELIVSAAYGGGVHH